VSLLSVLRWLSLTMAYLGLRALRIQSSMSVREEKLFLCIWSFLGRRGDGCDER
jgi:hypothetical protein